MESIKLDSRIRYIIFGTLGAFLLSILVGLFSKNPFGIVFIRAVVSSFIFGFILIVAWQLIKRYIPEILAVQKEENASGIVHERTGGLEEFTDAVESEIGEGGWRAAEFSSGSGEDGLQFPEGNTDEDQAEGDGLPSLDNLIDEEEVLPDERIGEETEKSSSSKGDYIDVGAMKFPNEPETLAKAVKRVMNQD